MTKTILLASCFAAAQAYAGPAPMPMGKGPMPPPPMDPVIPIGYNSISGYYEHTELDDPSDIDGLDGAGLTLEFSPLHNLFLTASGSWATGDSEWLGDVDVWSVSAGVGGYVTLTPGLDLVIDGGALWAGVEADAHDYDDSGFYIRPHLRAKFNIVEIHAGARYTNLDDTDENWQGFANVYVEVCPQLDLLAGVTADDEDWTIRAGARWRF